MSEPTKTTEKKVKIRLPISHKNKSDLFVGYNGTAYLIKRGVEVEVPKGVADIIAESEKRDAMAIENEIAMADNSKD